MGNDARSPVFLYKTIGTNWGLCFTGFLFPAFISALKTSERGNMFHGGITHQRVIPQWKTRVTCVLRVQSYDLRERRSILTCEYFALFQLDLFTLPRIDSFSARIFVPDGRYDFKDSYLQSRHLRGIPQKADVFSTDLLRNTNGIPHKLYNNKAFVALHQTRGTRWAATNLRNTLPRFPNYHQRRGYRTAILLPMLK